MMDENLRRVIYVGNLSEKIDEDILYELFLQAGPLESVRIATDKASGEQKPFAFVCYVHEESVPYAKHLLDGIEILNKQLRVQPKERSFQNMPLEVVGIHSLETETQHHTQPLSHDRANEHFRHYPSHMPSYHLFQHAHNPYAYNEHFAHYAQTCEPYSPNVGLSADLRSRLTPSTNRYRERRSMDSYEGQSRSRRHRNGNDYKEHNAYRQHPYQRRSYGGS